MKHPMIRLLVLTWVCALLAGCAPSGDGSATVEIVEASDVQWEALNPARGDKSPKAGTLWGDRNGAEATGFLVQFVDGFSSPPHTHNVTYRGVVISGLVHNDDPDAAKMWMPTGSYWTQPAGEVHITAAQGGRNIAYIEIGSGPYLVLPTEDASDNGERPVNVHASNLAWVRPQGVSPGDGPRIAYLWGSREGSNLNGALVRLPVGFDGAIHTHGPSFRAVVIEGQATHDGAAGALGPGSYFASTGPSVHALASVSGPCIVYVRAEGEYDILP